MFSLYTTYDTIKIIKTNLKNSISILCDLRVTLLAVDKNTDHQTSTPRSSKD